jgi:glycine/D-amino acid oxidase-like deaminating enzyme
MDPFLTCEAFAKRARVHGAKFHFGVDVTGMERRPGGGFRVLTTVDGVPTVQEADEVLICTGWIASTMAGWLDHNVPVKPMHGQMFSTAHPDLNLKHSLYSWEGPHYWATHKYVCVCVSVCALRLTCYRDRCENARLMPLLPMIGIPSGRR